METCLLSGHLISLCAAWVVDASWEWCGRHPIWVCSMGRRPVPQKSSRIRYHHSAVDSTMVRCW